MNEKKLIESGDTEQFIQQARTSSNITLISLDTGFGRSLLDWSAIHYAA